MENIEKAQNKVSKILDLYRIFECKHTCDWVVLVPHQIQDSDGGCSVRLMYSISPSQEVFTACSQCGIRFENRPIHNFVHSLPSEKYGVNANAFPTNTIRSNRDAHPGDESEIPPNFSVDDFQNIPSVCFIPTKLTWYDLISVLTILPFDLMKMVFKFAEMPTDRSLVLPLFAKPRFTSRNPFNTYKSFKKSKQSSQIDVIKRKDSYEKWENTHTLTITPPKYYEDSDDE